jgi:hypothetical protein
MTSLARMVVLLALLFGCTASGGSTPQPGPRTSTPRGPTELNVKAYGARGDGVADDRPAIQAALDAAHVQGIGIHLPAGIYNLRSATSARNVVLRTYPNQHLRGDGHSRSVLRLAGSFGDYVAVLGAPRDGTSIGRWSLTDLRIDQNDRNDNRLTVSRMARYPRMAVRVGSHEPGSSVTVVRCAFVRSDSVNVLYLYGERVRVQDSRFVEVGGAVGWATHDHSSIYTTTTIPGGVQEISRNIFRGVGGAGGARTAIETHGGRQLVSGNTVTGYLKGANLTGIADVPTRHVVFEQNTLSRVRVGVQIWAAYSRAAKSGVALSAVRVHRNSITVDRDLWSRVEAVAPATAVLITDPTAPIDGITIQGNVMRYLPSRIGEPPMEANSAAIYCLGNDRPRPLRGLKIVGNRIVSPLSTGVSRTCRVANAVVVGNTVVR